MKHIRSPDGRHRLYFYKLLDIVQDTEEIAHRDNLFPIQCENDEIVRDYARLDSDELTITEVVSHAGDPQRPTTMKFICRCKETADKDIPFAFKSSKYVQKIKEYINKHPELGPLKCKVHYKQMKKRKMTQNLVEQLQGYC